MVHRRLFDRFPEAREWSDDVTVIGPGMRLAGEIESEGTVVVAGRVDGRVRSGRMVLVLVGGVVTGPILAEAAVIDGAVDGDVEVVDQFELGASGRLRGDVTGPRIAVAEGAYLKGRVRPTGGPVKHFRERRQ